MNKNHPERERQAAGTMAHSVRTAQTYYRLRANQQRVATVTALIENPVRSPLLSPSTTSDALTSTTPSPDVEVLTTKRKAFCPEDVTALRKLAASHIEKRATCVANLGNLLSNCREGV